MRRTKKTDYMIMALLCLIALNIGNIIIGFYSSNKETQKIIDNEPSIASLSFEYIKDTLNISETLKKYINSLFPVVEVLLRKDKDDFEKVPMVPKYEEIDEEIEDDSERDIIIERLDEYESLIIVKDSDGFQSIENIPEPLMISKIKIDNDKPYILMYHTHATESYLLSKEDNYRNPDKKYNVMGIGSIISTVLEANGHKVDHVETYHDLPSYNQSYSRSLNTINKKREESSNLKILLDIHRDAVVENTSNIENIKAKSKIDINGKSVATFSLVVGPDSANKEAVLSFAKYIKAVSDVLYPKLCTGILIKPKGRYNQYLSDYSALIEVGYNFNTMEEANEGAKLVGEILTIVINSIIE